MARAASPAPDTAGAGAIPDPGVLSPLSAVAGDVFGDVAERVEDETVSGFSAISEEAAGSVFGGAAAVSGTKGSDFATASGAGGSTISALSPARSGVGFPDAGIGVAAGLSGAAGCGAAGVTGSGAAHGLC